MHMEKLHSIIFVIFVSLDTFFFNYKWNTGSLYKILRMHKSVKQKVIIILNLQAQR